jgi:mono/diheme cytochrome c family protein
MMWSGGPAKAGLYVLMLLALGAVGAAQSADPAAKTVWQGVYSEAQAARGKTEYTTHCASCHRDDLGGYNDILKGARFMEKNRETALHVFFEKTKTTMPRGAAGSLTDKAYVDIVSYVLKVNEFPAGTAELRVEDLQKVRVVGKDGPERVPDFALVRVVGCLTAEPNGAWTLTHASEPVRTGRPQPGEGEREEAAAWRLGPQTYRLLVSAAYGPAPLAGHRVEVRGFLIRRPTETRLNITSLETLDPSCGE